MLAQLRFDASPVQRTMRVRMRLQPAPPSDRCPFGCAAADNTSHLLSGCIQYHAAYVARHDRLVRHIAAMLGKLVPAPDELDLIVAGNLAAAVPEWVTDLRTGARVRTHPTRSPPSGTSTRATSS